MRAQRDRFDHYGFRDYYSRTYPRYKGYSDAENRQDLIDLVNVIYDNKKREFESELYELPDGSVNPNFRYHVNRVVSSDVICGELCAVVSEVALQTVQTPQAICAITNRIDIDKIYGNQDQLCAGNNYEDFDDFTIGFVNDDI